MTERVRADENKLLARARQAEKRVEEAALRQERERVAKLEREREAKRNAEVAALTLKGDLSDGERLGACQALVQARAELK